MTTKERLELFIKHLGISQGKFEKECGISNGYVNNIRSSIGNNVLEKILNKYTELNKIWLLHEEGLMLKTNEVKEPEAPYITERRNIKLTNKFQPIPNHDIDIAAANSQDMELHDDKNPAAEDYYYIPEFSGCRAFNCFSDSMDPLIKKGSKIFARKIEDWQDVLEFGQVYAIGLVDGRRFIKYIKKGSTPDKFLLASENKHYDPFEVPFRLIRSIWLIDGSMDKMTQSTYFILKQ